MLEIDGSYLEGGGQIARTAVALSAITRQPCRIFNIRKGRPKPGLKPQHLNSIQAAAKLCNGNLKGDRIESTEIEFYPKEIEGGKHRIDVGTAGSIGLVLQTLIPICLFADKEVELEIKGGTDVKWAPNIEYFKEVFCKSLRKMEIEIETEIVRYGFYPKGGGLVRVKIKPCKKLKPLNRINA